MAESTNVKKDDESLKLALAISLLRSKVLQNKKDPNSLASSQSDALRWKRKAKERKQELLSLREDLKCIQDASQCDLYPENASCKCYFFDNLGQKIGNSSDSRFNDVLRRRFLRQVRFKERSRRVGSSSQRRPTFGSTVEDEIEQLRSSADFLVELCGTISPVNVESKFANLAHQAVDFILVSLKNLLSTGRSLEPIEGVINNLVTHLVRQMCSPSQADGSRHTDNDRQIYIQHLIRKLGSEPYIGQRAILSISQRISVLAERLIFSDPFDDTFPGMNECMFTMIQLVEFLVSDYFLKWSEAEDFDSVLLEDWVTSILGARKALELLESRNGLYLLYMDRVTGELAKQVGQVSSLQNLKPDIINGLLC